MTSNIVWRITTDAVIVPDYLQRNAGFDVDFDGVDNRPKGNYYTGYAPTKAELMDTAKLDKVNGGKPEIEKVYQCPDDGTWQPIRKADPKHYVSICKELGMRADLGFVEITPKGEISFSVGKPDDVRMLLQRARYRGYAIAPQLARAAKY